ncbi:MAG: hypothetical protein OXG58_08055 [Gemmatimonadetes bacterium]|nr:hypothetical protein [Gemmatimonadota bacterium]MCY3943312.1 hypothetical protein [Gemmatimonadota bacterium]
MAKLTTPGAPCVSALRWAAAFISVVAAFVPQPSRAQPADTLERQWERESFDTLPLVRPILLLATSWGEVWVTDVGERAVFRWSAMGEELSRVGGVGEGPGEYLRPGLLIEMDGDSVGLWDRQLQRMSFFGRNGEFLSVRVMPVAVSAHGFVRSMGLRGDTVLAMTITYPGIEPGPRDNQAVLWRFVGTGLWPDSLFAIRDESIATIRHEGGLTRFLAPFRGRTYAFLSNRGSVVVSHGEDSALSVLDGQGRQMRRVELDLPPPLAVTRADREHFSDSLRLALEDGITRTEASPADLATLRGQHRRLLQSLEFPNHHPRYTDAFQDTAGSLRLRMAAPSNAKHVEWRAYDHMTGGHLRSVFLPNGAFLNTRTADGSAFFVTQADELGQSRLVMYGR